MTEVFCGNLEVNAHVNNYLESQINPLLQCQLAHGSTAASQTETDITHNSVKLKEGRLLKVAQLVLCLLRTEEPSANSGISFRNHCPTFL